jgi:hypothetical protein
MLKECAMSSKKKTLPETTKQEGSSQKLQAIRLGSGEQNTSL